MACNPGFSSTIQNHVFLLFCMVSSLCTLVWMCGKHVTSVSSIALLILTTWQWICYSCGTKHYSIMSTLFIQSIFFTLLIQTLVTITVWQSQHQTNCDKTILFLTMFIVIRITHSLWMMGWEGWIET